MDTYTKTQLEKLFIQHGLRKIDLLVYHTLDLKGKNITEIAKEVKSYRPQVYASIKRLLQNKLIKKISPKKRTLYIRNNSQTLKEFFFQNTISQNNLLSNIISTKQSLPENIYIYSGKKDLQKVLHDLLNQTPKDGIFYRISARKPQTDIQKFMPKAYSNVRDKKKIQQFVITNHALRNSSYKKRMDCASKVIPPKEDNFEYGMNILIYGNTTVFVNFETKVAYAITDVVLCNVLKGLFKLLYNRLDE